MVLTKLWDAFDVPTSCVTCTYKVSIETNKGC